MKKKLLFVCLGNICRSPAASSIMRTKLKNLGLDGEYECDSAGTIGHHRGESPDLRMIKACLERGYQLSGSSRKISVNDLSDFDYIFAMDDDNYTDILSLDDDCSYYTKIYKICSFSSDNAVTCVPDPYYGGVDGFNKVISILEDCSDQIIIKLLGKKDGR